MGKQLVLAEKPSVGRELARVLQCRKRERGFSEGDRYVVTKFQGLNILFTEYIEQGPANCCSKVICN